MATINEIRNSFFNILKVSFVLTSPNAKARITIVEDCAPAFPPVSISIGINEESITTDCSTSSYLLIILPVNVAEIISTINQLILCLAIVKALVFK